MHKDRRAESANSPNSFVQRSMHQFDGKRRSEATFRLLS
jgi:hypothetical protein